MKTFQKLKSNLVEKHLTSSEKKKREEIAQAIHRDNPGMPMAKKMAIATAQAKKVAEAKDPREYDYEGDMAKSQLRSIIANAQTVHDMLEDTTNIAEWVQSKITLSADYMSTVRDYMQAEKVAEETEDQHLCATHVYSNMYGEGVVVEGAHADPDEDGNIEWYLVEFNDCVKKVYTEKIEVMIAEYHDNHKKKKKKVVNGN